MFFFLVFFRIFFQFFLRAGAHCQRPEQRHFDPSLGLQHGDGKLGLDAHAVPVHVFGLPCDMDPILDLAAAHGLFVIEDAAQAIGAETTVEIVSRIAAAEPVDDTAQELFEGGRDKLKKLYNIPVESLAVITYLGEDRIDFADDPPRGVEI